MSSTLVSLITVNYNGKDHLAPFMASVEALDFPREQLEVIIVDNGSQDGSVEFLRAAHPWVKVIQNDANMGFAKANNQGAKDAKGQYLALLNNDMRLEPDWLKQMLAAIDKAPEDVVCLGSRILNWDGTLIDFIGGTLSFNGMGFQTSFRAPVDSEAGRQYPDELLFACGGAMLINRQVYLEVGGFDEDYFAYFEDVDLGWRLWVLGYRVAFCPEAVAYHRHNGTSSQFGWHKKLVLFERNALYSLVKNYDDQSLAAFLPASLLLAFKRMATRSGLSREEYNFTVTQSPPAPSLPVGRTKGAVLVKKALKVLRHEGPRSCVKKIGVKLAEALLRRWRDLPSQPVPEGFHAIRPDAYATVVGVEDLLDHLPHLMEKRQQIQAKRRRSDDEILPLFKTPFQPTETQGAYPEAFFTTIQSLGVEAFYERRAAHARAQVVNR